MGLYTDGDMVDVHLEDGSVVTVPKSWRGSRFWPADAKTSRPRKTTDAAKPADGE